MKLHDIHSPRLLLEADIVNLDDIDRFVTRIATELENPAAVEWFRTKVAQWIRRSDQFHVPMTDQNRPQQLPDFAVQKMTQDPEHAFFVFAPSGDLEAHLMHLVDYFNSQPADAEIWTKLPTKGVQQLIVYAERWVTDAVRQNQGNDANEGTETVLVIGGLRWIRHTDMATVRRDGAILRNCLATGHHDSGIIAGQKVIYTLRDAANKPHVAFMLIESGNAVGEIKGKQNKPPVGRYIGATKDLLNALKLPAKSSAVNDIANMGLYLDSKTQVYGTILDLTETVMELAGGYIVGKMPSKQGEEFFIGRVNQPHLIKMVRRTDGKLEFQNFAAEHKDLIRSLVQPFVNTYWDTGAPPPYTSSDSYGYARGNTPHLQLDLPYDYHSKKYGRPTEISQEVYRGEAGGGFRVMAWGRTLRDTEYVLIDAQDKQIGLIKMSVNRLDQVYAMAPDGAAQNPEDGRTYSSEPEDLAPIGPAVIEFLNNGFERAPAPVKDIYEEGFREQLGMFFDSERGVYAPFNEATRVIYKFRDGMEVRKLRETGSIYYSFIKGGKKLYELIRHGDAGSSHIGRLQLHDINYSGHRETPEFGRDLTPKQRADLAKRMVEMLNRAPEFTEQSLEQIATAFPDLDIYVNSQKQWGRADDVAEVVLETADGTFKRVAKDGKNWTVLLIQNGHPVVEFETKPDDDKIAGHRGREYGPRPSNFKFSNAAAAALAGPAFIDFLNHFKVMPLDPPTAEDWREDYTDHDGKQTAALWKMGCFGEFDKPWRLLQTGKVAFQGDGYKLVNFRNRVLFVRADGALMGEATKHGRDLQDRFGLAKIMAYGPWSNYRDLLKLILKATQAGAPITLPQGIYDADSRWSQYGQYGIEMDPHSNLRDVEEIHPPQAMMSFSDGWEWRRMPFLGNRGYPWKDLAKGHATPEHRYSLVNPQGDIQMVLMFDQEKYLSGIRYQYVHKVTSGYDKGKIENKTADAVNAENMKSLMKYFTAFMEKGKFRMTPSQYRDAGIFVGAGGKIRSLKDDPQMLQYLQGKITFKDGYELVKEYSHVNEWRLFRPKREGDDNYDYSRRMLTITLTDEGIEKIEPENREAKRNFHKYMPYLKTLVQIFARVIGEEIEE